MLMLATIELYSQFEENPLSQALSYRVANNTVEQQMLRKFRMGRRI
jgi:hypothetical protein